MTFTPGCPFDGQSLLSSKPQVRGNFTSLYNSIDENHYPPNDPLDGKHRKSVYPEQSAPFPSTIANECVTFARDYNGATQLMYRPENTAAGGDAWALSGIPQRAFVRFSTVGVPVTATVTGASFNVTNVTRVSPNPLKYQINLTTPFPIGAATQNDYAVMVFGSGLSTITVETLTAASFVINFGNVANTSDHITVIVLGG